MKDEKTRKDGKDVYTYRIGDNLYVNLTNRCTNRCSFCVRNGDTYEGYPLWLREGEPTAEQVIAEIPDPAAYREVVFCGYGEPTYRLDAMLKIADHVHKGGGMTRLNTNGHGSMINQREIAPLLKGAIDRINISLNAPDGRRYERLCRPVYPDMAFDSVIFFARSCKEEGLDCWFSVVDCIGEEQIAECRALADKVGIPLRVRKTIE